MVNSAIYPGTFDPITKGHVDLVQRAAKLFDIVIIGIATSSRKAPCYDLQQRIAMCEACFVGVSNIKVVALEGLLVEFVKQHDANFIIRGLRSVGDFDYELQQAAMNHSLDASIETIFLPAAPEHSFVSATMVREILSLGGDASAFLPPEVIPLLS